MNNRRSSLNRQADSCQVFVNIRYHQHSSWQGSIQRLDTGETISFRSALELLTLIETVVDQQAGSNDTKKRLRQWKMGREVAGHESGELSKSLKRPTTAEK